MSERAPHASIVDFEKETVGNWLEALRKHVERLFCHGPVVKFFFFFFDQADEAVDIFIISMPVLHFGTPHHCPSL